MDEIPLKHFCPHLHLYEIGRCIVVQKLSKSGKILNEYIFSAKTKATTHVEIIDNILYEVKIGKYIFYCFEFKHIQCE